MTQLTVVIPTYNRLHRLRQVLAALEAQTVPLDQFDVVVVSDGATDGTAQFLQAIYSPLRLNSVLQENAGVAAARNSGIEQATTDLILFLDDDVVPAPDLVQKHLEAQADFGPDTVVLGPMLTPDDFSMHPWVDWEQQMLVKQYDDMTAGKYAPTARQFFTGNTSLERRHLVEVGGFDTRFRRAEDVELAYRLDKAGLKFVFKGDAVGFHYAERSFDSWLATPYAYGRNDVVFSRDMGCDWLLPTMWREYHGRHPLIRRTTTLCLDRPAPSKLLTRSLKTSAEVAPASARFAYSAIFNLRYYQGVADELGGREAFFAGVADHAPDLAQSTTDETQFSPQNL